jgi:hypothetical protein
MDMKAVIANLDAEIAKLQHAKTTLLGIDSTSETPAKRRGRPKGSGTKTAKRQRRTMPPESRAKIAAAQKKRWALAKKTAN